MRRAKFASAILGIASIFAAIIPVSAQKTPAPTPPPNDHMLRTAIVRIGYIYRNMQESAQSYQSLSTRYSQMQQEGTKRQSEIGNIDNQLKTQFKVGSKQWYDLRATLDDKKLELETWTKKMQLELDREKKKALIEQYRHVNEAVEAVANQEHLDLVISDYTPEIVGPDLDGIPQQQLEQLVLQRAVLFAGKKADITEEVLTLVEANFAKQKQAIGSGPNQPAVPPAPGLPAPTGH
jgi:Skp family chaperone for outer membrane proteins